MKVSILAVLLISLLIIHELPTPDKQLPGTDYAGDYEAIMPGHCGKLPLNVELISRSCSP